MIEFQKSQNDKIVYRAIGFTTALQRLGKTILIFKNRQLFVDGNFNKVPKNFSWLFKKQEKIISKNCEGELI